MQRLWGRRISDLGHGNFARLLPHVAKQTGTHLGLVERYFPSSGGSLRVNPGQVRTLYGSVNVRF